MRRKEQWIKLAGIGTEYFPEESGFIRDAIQKFWKGNHTPSLVMPVHALRMLSKTEAGRHWKTTKPIVDRVVDAGLDQAPMIEAQVMRFIEREGLRRVALEIAVEVDRGRGSRLDARTIQRRVQSLCLDGSAGDRGGKLGGSMAYRNFLEVGRVSSGLPAIDYALSGGFGRGELTMFLGAWGGGKTTALVNFGAYAAEQGESVLHISMEIPYWQVSCRYEQNITGDVFETVVGRKQQKGISSLKGSVVVLDYSHMRLTPGQIEALCTDHKPTLVLLDYAALCRLDGGVYGSDGGRRIEVGEIFRELRRIAAKLQIPLLTAHQATREASRSGEFGGNDVSEDISIMHTADNVICINQNPMEKRRGRGWLVIEKTRVPRSNANRQIEVVIDYDRQRIRQVGKEPEKTAPLSRRQRVIQERKASAS